MIHRIFMKNLKNLKKIYPAINYLNYISNIYLFNIIRKVFTNIYTLVKKKKHVKPI